MDVADQAEMFGSIAMSSPVGVFASDVDGYILWANPVAAALFGWPREALIGQRFTVLLPEETHDRVLAIRRSVLSGEQTGPYLTEGLRRDGTRFGLEVTPAVRYDAGGRLVGTHMVARDVTDELGLRRGLTEALARSRARFDQSAKPQALLDLRGRFVEVNDAACALLGWAREELVGLDSVGLVDPTDPGEVRRYLSRLREGTLVSAGYETSCLRKDGTRLPVHVEVTAVRNDAGEPYELVAVGTDLTDLRETQRRLVSREAFFRALNRESSDVTLVVGPDGRLTYVSPSAGQVLGHEPATLLDVLGADIAHPEDLAAIGEHRQRLARGAGARERFTVRIRDADRAWRWFAATVTNCLEDVDITGMVVNLREVSSEMEADRALRESETRYRTILETAQEGIVTVSPTGAVLFANERIAEILGLEPAQVYALGSDALRQVLGADPAARTGPEVGAGPRVHDHAYRHPDGRPRMLHVSVGALTATDGGSLGTLAMVSDVTEQREAEAALRRQALHDPLTGLPNRLLFVDRLGAAARRLQRRKGRGVAVLFLDLDHFKLVNDTHGHETGDQLLVEVAARVSDSVRSSDTVARLGGDEFAVICEEADAETVATVAARVQESLKQPIRIGADALHVGVSIGVALSPPHDVTDLLRFADTAMYRAKMTSRGAVMTFDSGLTQDSDRQQLVVAALRETLEGGGPSLGYQPVVGLPGRGIVGLEALLRPDEPRLGPIGAQELLRAAEGTGLHHELDRAVLHAAAATMVTLRASGVVGDDVHLSVNLSPRTARQHSLVALVDGVLDATGLPGRCLVLEVTEAAVVGVPEQAATVLRRLLDRGVRVAIDDFGTGHGSLAHLRDLPVSFLKVDRTLVHELGSGDQDAPFARAVVELARAIGGRTVAVGVETEAQARAVEELGCHGAQGFLWGAAAPAGGLERMLGELNSRTTRLAPGPG